MLERFATPKGRRGQRELKPARRTAALRDLHAEARFDSTLSARQRAQRLRRCCAARVASLAAARRPSAATAQRCVSPARRLCACGACPRRGWPRPRVLRAGAGRVSARLGRPELAGGNCRAAWALSSNLRACARVGEICRRHRARRVGRTARQVGIEDRTPIRVDGGDRRALPRGRCAPARGELGGGAAPFLRRPSSPPAAAWRPARVCVAGARRSRACTPARSAATPRGSAAQPRLRDGPLGPVPPGRWDTTIYNKLRLVLVL